MIPGVVLAAGASERMGRPKALLPLPDGQPFIARIVSTLYEAGVEDVVIVTRGDLELAGALASLDRPVRILVNEQPAAGQLSSILTALAVVDRPGVNAMLMTLVDLPLVSPATVRAVIEAFKRTGGPIVRPVRGHQHGHPVLFARSIFDELRRADPREGAKLVVRRYGSQAVGVPLDDLGAFEDIDTAEDYERIVGRRIEP